MQNAEPIERFDEFVCIGRDVDPEIVAAEVHLKGRESTLQCRSSLRQTDPRRRPGAGTRPRPFQACRITSYWCAARQPMESCLTGPRPRCEVRYSRYDLTASGAPLYPARYTFASLPALIRPTTSVASPADRIASTTDR